MNHFQQYFSQIKDTRQQWKVKHLLTDIIGLSLLAVISGAESYEDIEEYGLSKKEWLKNYLLLPYDIPSHDTIERLMEAMNPKDFNIHFTNWVKKVFQVEGDFLIHIDGKSNRRSFDHYTGKKMLHALNVYAGEHHLSLAQMKVADKNNEITAIPQLLEILDLKGNTITIDAIGCQQAIAQEIVKSNSFYVLAVKGNQQGLHDQIENAFSLHPISNTDQTIEKSHGRLEERTCSVLHDLRFVDEDHLWKDLSSIIRMKSKRTINNITQEETRYYISNHRKDAPFFQSVIRSHWLIENESNRIYTI